MTSSIARTAKIDAADQLRLLQHAVDNVNDVVMITEADPIDEPGPCIVYVNPAFEKMTGYTAEEVRGRSPRFLQGPGTSRATRDRIRKALVAQEPVRAELLNHRKDGSEFWVEVDISPVLDPSGRLTHFVSVQRDVSRRKVIQQALEKSKRNLDEAQRVAHLGSWEWDVQQDVAYWSDEMYRLCGLEPQSCTMKRLSFLERVHPEDRVSLHALVDHALTTGESVEKIYRIVRPDGVVRQVHSRACVMTDREGKPVRLIGTTQDIGERLETEDAKLRAAKCEASNLELQSFSYSVSHDLRAPVRRMISYAHILDEEQNRAGLSDEGRHCIQSIIDCARQMNRLIEDMLSLAEVARSDMRRGRCDLSALAAAVMAELQQAHPERQVKIEIAPSLVADADVRLTRIVLQNLLGNAWKFTGRTPHAHIEIGQQIQNGRPVFFVRDNGVGFDPAYVGHLFKPFERLHPATEFEGSGIGLATVRRIVERHGGTAWAEGTTGQGAVFYFTLE